MPFLIAKLFFGLGWLKNAALSVFKWVVGHPWQALSIALALWGAYERYDGIRGWQSARDWESTYNSHIADDQRIAEQTKAQSNTTAKEGDRVHTIIKTVYRDASARFIAANSFVVPEGSVSAPAEGNPSGVPSPSPSASIMVATKPDDINACSDSYAYALSAFLWGQARVKDGRAEYAPDDGAVPDSAFGR